MCDEAVSALDVSIQAQIINLLEDLREEFGLTYLFIGHDLSVVRHFCHRVAVMYVGKLVEVADSDELFDNPLHPYTRALLSAIPVPDPEVEEQREHRILPGEVPSPLDPPPGCVFHPRCAMAVEACRTRVPVPWSCARIIGWPVRKSVHDPGRRRRHWIALARYQSLSGEAIVCRGREMFPVEPDVPGQFDTGQTKLGRNRL